MTALSLAAGEIAIHEQLLGANVQDTVTCTFASSAQRRQVRVVNINGAGAVYFTTNGADVTVGAKTVHGIPAFAGASKVVDLPVEDENPAVADTATIKIKSAAAVIYTVEVG